MSESRKPRWDAVWQGGLVIFLIVWAIVEILLPGRTPSVDDGFFKEPGYMFRTHGVLASPAYKGFHNLSPDVSGTYAVYQPLYSLGYAGWLLIFPHTFRSAAAYDALIRIVLVMTIMWGLPRLVPDISRGAASAVGFTSCFLGSHGRPDDLALVFGYLGLMFWLGARYRAQLGWAVLGGASLGLCGASSIPVLVVLLLVGGSLWIATFWSVKEKWPWGWRGVLTGTILALVLGLVLIPFYARPGALAQYRQASRIIFSHGIFLAIGDGSLLSYLDVLRSSCRSMIFQLPLYATLPVLMILGFRGPDRATWKALATGVLLALLFLLTFLPQQYFYIWFIFPVMMLLVVAKFRNQLLVSILIVLTVLVAINPSLRAVIRASDVPRDQTLEASERAVVDIVPQGKRIFVSDESYFLVRRHYGEIRSDYDGAADGLAEADYCVFGPLPLVCSGDVYIPRRMFSKDNVAVLEKQFELVWNNLPTKRSSVFGIPIGSTAPGYGVLIYRRKTFPPQ